MKKIFTLMLASFLTVALFAADRKPSVTLNAPKKYEIVIDGKSYFSNNQTTISIDRMRSGFHTVKVYETSRLFFMKTKKLVASSSFQLRNNDIAIDVSRFGQINISESRFDHGGWNDHDNDHGYGQSNDHGYGQQKGGGRGNRF